MNSYLASWKTTFLGIAGIVAVIAKWVKAGSVDFNDIPTVMALAGSVYAKDSNVTGGTQQQ